MGTFYGGPKDLDPPKVITSKPENYSLRFTGQKIEITFDEFIVLKDISRELIISPPLKERPDVRLRNKTIIIDLKNELNENTTYTLNFCKAIADNNEGNILTNYEFVFSTGDFLDSLSIEGRVLNAFDLQPSKDPISIMLYNKIEDSIPLKEIPVYIGKTDTKGAFRINNLRADTYKIFALKDQNYNFLFDMTDEEIAFADTIIPLTPEFLRSLPERLAKPDTVPLRPAVKKTVGRITADTLQRIQSDSITKKYELPAIYVDMFSFTEQSKFQFISFNQRMSSELIEFGFNLPLKEELVIRPLNIDTSGSWFLPEANTARDTFKIWLTDTTFINQDTLKFELIYSVLDSMGNIYSKNDTLNFLYRKPVKTRSRRADEKEVKEIPKLNVTTIKNRSNLDLNRSIPFTFNFPLLKTDNSFINLFVTKDSIEHRIGYEIKRDSISLRRLALENKWEEKTPYRLLILPGAFTDIYGNTNDTIKSVFTTTEKESYGTLILDISEVTTPLVIQLMNTNEVVIEERYISHDDKVIMEYLSPASYIVKFIHDRNNNRKWDTGNYLEHRQAEKVSYYVDEITIRANWELEINYSSGTVQ